jgi:hypothetical protein
MLNIAPNGIHSSPKAIDMGIMERNGLCHDAGDCIVTSLAFIAVLVAWIILLCWMLCGSIA